MSPLAARPPGTVDNGVTVALSGKFGIFVTFFQMAGPITAEKQRIADLPAPANPLVKREVASGRLSGAEMWEHPFHEES